MGNTSQKKQGFFKSIASAVLGNRRGYVASSFAYATSATSGLANTERLVRDCPTVLACVQTVARTIGELDIEASDSAVQRLIENPNKWQTRYEFIHGLVFDLLLHGNAYIRVLKTSGGRRLQLVPEDPKNVRVEWADDRTDVKYTMTYEGSEVYFTSGDIVHIRDVPSNDILSVSRVQMTRPRIEALISADRLIADTFRFGGSLGYSVEIPSKLTPEETESLGEAMVQNFVGEGGQSKRNGIVVIPGGGKVVKHEGMTPADADLRELRQDLIREIAGVFGVPPFIAGGTGDTKYANVTARLQAMYRDAIAPIVSNLEERLSKAMGGKVEFMIEDLLTGDLATQITSATMAAGGPILTPNESREILGKEPIEGEGMDEVRANGMTPTPDELPHGRDGENQGEEPDE